MGERRNRMWWVIGDDGRPAEHRGWFCGPENDFWWFPSAGWSTSQVFEDESSALDVALKQARSEVSRANAVLNDLEARSRRHHQGKGRP